MNHFCYRTDYPDGYYYIGKHSTRKAIEDDSYCGSGTQVQKRKDGIRTILSISESSKDAYIKEKELVGDLWKTDPFCLNMKPGGKGAGSGEDHHCYGKIVSSKVGFEATSFGKNPNPKGRPKGSNCGQSGENHPMYGYQYSDAQRLAMSLRVQELGTFTKPRSESHKSKIAKALTGKPKSEEHKSKLRMPKPKVVCRLSDRKELIASHIRYL